MEDNEILENLEKLLGELGIAIRYEKGDFSGGFCRYKDNKQLIINKSLETARKINIISTELKTNVDFEEIYIMPALREIIENESRLG